VFYYIILRQNAGVGVPSVLRTPGWQAFHSFALTINYTFAHSKRPQSGQLWVSKVMLIAHFQCAMV